MSSCRKDTNKKLPVLQLSFIYTCNTGNWNHSLRARNFIQPLKHVYIYTLTVLTLRLTRFFSKILVDLDKLFERKIGNWKLEIWANNGRKSRISWLMLIYRSKGSKVLR